MATRYDCYIWNTQPFVFQYLIILFFGLIRFLLFESKHKYSLIQTVSVQHQLNNKPLHNTLNNKCYLFGIDYTKTVNAHDGVHNWYIIIYLLLFVHSQLVYQTSDKKWQPIMFLMRSRLEASVVAPLTPVLVYSKHNS